MSAYPASSRSATIAKTRSIADDFWSEHRGRFATDPQLFFPEQLSFQEELAATHACRKDTELADKLSKLLAKKTPATVARI